MILGTDDFRREPDFSGGHGHQREVGPDKSSRGKFDDRTSGQETGGDRIQTRRHAVMQKVADAFVPFAGREPQNGFAFENLFVGLAHDRRTLRKNVPVCERGFAASISGVPCPTIRPPASPASGPRSMTQSASAIKSRLCSMTITE